MDETPIMFQPSLAKLVGLHEAIVLQTLRFWCGNKKSGKVIDGERWIYNSAAEWRELSFPFWSTKTIGDLFLTLEKMGLVKSAQFDLKEGKARKYYTMTESALTILTVEKADQLEESSDTMWKNVLGDMEDSSRSARARLIKQYTENLTENTLTPIVPFHRLQEGIEETSAMASDSKTELVSPKGTDVDADAESGKSDDLISTTPHSVKSVTGRGRKISPPTTIPPELDCQSFLDAWNDFLTHRKEKRKPVTPTNERALLGKLREWGSSSATEALRASVMNGWIGVFKPKEEEWKPTTI